MKNTRLLIVTQAVDLDDPVLGFFHGWITALATGCERIEVICLKEGRHDLPANVAVHSLGKESGPSRLKYLMRFFTYVSALWRRYDAVFVHMNAEYAALGGPLWRLGGKRVVLWRNHRQNSFIMRLGVRFVHAVCYTSPDAYVARYGKAVRMPVGIDTKKFTPPDTPAPHDKILFLGRLDAVKKPDIFLKAMRTLPEAKADIYGDPTLGREAYADGLKRSFGGMPNAAFHAGVRNDETPALYRSHGIYVNLTPSGSFDKTIGEAMSCGCIAVVANGVVRGAVPDAHIVDPSSPASVAAGIRAALALSPDERLALARRGREYVEREHSLSLLAGRLRAIVEP